MIMSIPSMPKRHHAWRNLGFCLDASVEAIRAFAEVNENLHDCLLNIGTRHVFYTSPHPYWGMGPFWDWGTPPRGQEGANNWWGIVVKVAACAEYADFCQRQEGGDQPDESPDDATGGPPPEEGDGTSPLSRDTDMASADFGAQAPNLPGQGDFAAEEADSMEEDDDAAVEAAAVRAAAEASRPDGANYAGGVGRGQALEQYR
jgi:hypothetical protein